MLLWIRIKYPIKSLIPYLYSRTAYLQTFNLQYYTTVFEVKGHVREGRYGGILRYLPFHNCRQETCAAVFAIFLPRLPSVNCHVVTRSRARHGTLTTLPPPSLDHVTTSAQSKLGQHCNLVKHNDSQIVLFFFIVKLNWLWLLFFHKKWKNILFVCLFFNCFFINYSSNSD